MCLPEHREYPGHLPNGTDLVADDLLTCRSCGTCIEKVQKVLQPVTHLNSTTSCGSRAYNAPHSLCAVCLIPQILVKRSSNSVSLLKTEHVSPLLVYPGVQETNTMQTHCYWSLKFSLQKMVCIYKHITSSE